MYAAAPQMTISSKDEEIRALKARCSALARDKAHIAAAGQVATGFSRSGRGPPKSRSQALQAVAKARIEGLAAPLLWPPPCCTHLLAVWAA